MLVGISVLTTVGLRRYYADHKNEFESAKARHILIKYKGSPVPLREGKMECSTCHNPHGSTNVRQLRKGDSIAEACTSCHAIDRVNTARFSPERWRVVTLDMRERGARLEDTELERLVEWLGRTKGTNDSDRQ